ncbi:ABC transporter ATP-binding protein [Brucella anthropi]|uniref:ABC transporter ATP-binding protein n=1 Tax=Brucella anthropi TaxID=529 RepID=UPI000DFB07C9|nr:ABC transporter ATP-binding protein [Brucella anthropi]SUB56159.1 Glutathione import ATP-binding protein GsiA [Brucella anthropi]
MSELLDVRSLRTYFETDKGTVKSVDDISFTLKRGEVMGLVGESGSGKSITGFSLIGLLDETGRIQEGSSIRFNGRELVGLDGKELRKLRGKDISMVFQDPMMTLNPVVRIIDQIGMAIRAHEQVSDAEVRRRAVEALAKVKIVDPESKVDQYPHEFSGGMRQRVAIAIALLHRPQLVIADEPTTALDVSVQAEILIMVKALVAEMGTSLIWVSHDLATVSSIADTIAVMRRGKIVESGPAEAGAATIRSIPIRRGCWMRYPLVPMPGKPLASAATEAAGPMDLSGPWWHRRSALRPMKPFVKAEAIEKIFARRIGFLRGLGIRWGLLREPGPVHAVISANLTIASRGDSRPRRRIRFR